MSTVLEVTVFVKHFYDREEDFLADFEPFASAAAAAMKGEWHPNFGCGDDVRASQQYLYDLGVLNHLVFQTAALYFDTEGFSRLQLKLRSSHRQVRLELGKDGSVRIEEAPGKPAGAA